MEFRLPQNLQTELLAYDPALKALARQQKQTKQTKKQTHPLGKPQGLIPTDVVRESLFNDAVDNINNMAVQSRYHTFQRFNGGNPKFDAILYHYEQCWYAAWLPPQGQESDYVYGYSYAFKNTQTAIKQVPRKLQNYSELTEVKFGKSKFHVYSKTVTKQNIIDGNKERGWNLSGVPCYYQKSGQLHRLIKQFESQLITTIPTWEDSNHIFERLQTTNLSFILYDSYANRPSEAYDISPDWLPSYNNLFDMIVKHAHYPTGAFQQGHTYRDFNRILHIINTPFIKRWIQNQCDQIIANYNNEDNKYKNNLVKPWNKILTYLQQIQTIHCIWPDCPLDYYQTNVDTLVTVNFTSNAASSETIQWLNKHMPVASFFTMLNKFYEKETAEQKINPRRFQTNEYRFFSFTDTISMLNRLLEKQVTVQKPDRWRIEEFHDYIQGEAWKVKNENIALPQDLFPTPIKTTIDDQTWTFFQPIDTHQLAAWGQAVRNCVGNATHYAEDVRKKKHFIVLCMINNKPMFTIQLEVNNGLMSVKQIAGVANARLSDDQKLQYQQTFADALAKRNAELVS